MSSRGEVTAGRDKRRRPRGYDPDWRPRAATLALLEQVDAVLEEYEDYLPLSVRQIFYRLVAGHGYEKTERGYGRLADCLVRARRAKRVPFAVIRDDSAGGLVDRHFDSREDFEDDAAKRIRDYRLDRQTGQPVRLELFCEAAGMRDQLWNAVSGYTVPVYSGGGFDSLTAQYQLARRALSRDVPTVVLHVGDFDPSGASIFTSLTENAAAFVEADRVLQTQRIEAVRVALTAEQVEAGELPTAPPKPTDSRSTTWRGETCQLEALAPDDLAEIVLAAVRERIDEDVRNDVLWTEKYDRDELLGLPPGTT